MNQKRRLGGGDGLSHRHTHSQKELITDGGVEVVTTEVGDVQPRLEVDEGDILRELNTEEKVIYSYRDGETHITVDVQIESNSDASSGFESGLNTEVDEACIVYKTPSEIERVVEQQHLPTIPENWKRAPVFDHPDEGGPTKQIYFIEETEVWTLIQHPRPELAEYMYTVRSVGNAITPNPNDVEQSNPSEYNITEEGLHADYYIRALLGAGCTVTRAVDYYFIQIKGMNNAEWRNAERNATMGAVSSSLSEARSVLRLNPEKLS